ncbi:MAG TPA: sulfatase-like hydrolase/transferase, partial [Anaerolineales bacterium]
LGYFHFLPPHGPYNTSLEFYNHFGQDGFAPAGKPDDVFTIHVPRNALLKRRAEYDEFLLYADQNFGRLFEYLESSGLLENTWVVFTSDHGEMFERGISGHSTNALYQPVVRIPLLIFEPGRQTGTDVYTPTSAVDVLPTLAHLTGQPIPAWTEGAVLPPFASAAPDADRNLYVVRSTKTDPAAPMTQASLVLVKEPYKLHYYFGYPDRGVDELVRLYDIQADPEELVDLYASQPAIAADLLAQLKAKLAEVDKPYL